MAVISWSGADFKWLFVRDTKASAFRNGCFEVLTVSLKKGPSGTRLCDSRRRCPRIPFSGAIALMSVRCRLRVRKVIERSV